MAAYIRECIRKNPPTTVVCNKPHMPARVYESIPDINRGVVAPKKSKKSQGAPVKIEPKSYCIAYIAMCVLLLICLFKGLKIKW